MTVPDGDPFFLFFLCTVGPVVTGTGCVARRADCVYIDHPWSVPVRGDLIDSPITRHPLLCSIIFGLCCRQQLLLGRHTCAAGCNGDRSSNAQVYGQWPANAPAMVAGGELARRHARPPTGAHYTRRSELGGPRAVAERRLWGVAMARGRDAWATRATREQKRNKDSPRHRRLHPVRTRVTVCRPTPFCANLLPCHPPPPRRRRRALTLSSARPSLATAASPPTRRK